MYNVCEYRQTYTRSTLELWPMVDVWFGRPEFPRPESTWEIKPAHVQGLSYWTSGFL